MQLSRNNASPGTLLRSAQRSRMPELTAICKAGPRSSPKCLTLMMEAPRARPTASPCRLVRLEGEADSGVVA